MGADPFVGRETENAALDAALGDAWSGRGRLFLVAGDPGIGKSRLAAELTDRARASGAQVGWGRCWEAGGAPAYWPWAEVLTTLVDRIGPTELRERLGATTDDLAQIVPMLSAEAPDARLAPDTARFRLYEAVVRLCRLSTIDAPLVAVLDDVHVADPSSLLLLQFLAGHLDGMGLLVVATYRDADAMGGGFADVLAQLVRERNTTRLRLGGLDADGVAEVIGGATGIGPSQRLVAKVRELTDGNPLYVGEAARLLATEGRLDDTLESDRLLIPRDVRETVLRRLGQLSEPCQRVLELASVLGRDFPLDVLEALGGDDVDVTSALDEAASVTVIVDSPDRAGHLRFAHAVMSEALHHEIPSLRRRRLHDEAGRGVEVLRGGDLGPRLAELARHCYASLPVGPVDRAVTYARLAAERAVQQLAYEEGARLYDMALRALAGAPDGMERMELLLALGDAQSRAGETDVAKATFIEAADLARQMGDVERLAAGRARLQRALRVDACRIRHEDHPVASRGTRCTSRRGQRAPCAAARAPRRSTSRRLGHAAAGRAQRRGSRDRGSHRRSGDIGVCAHLPSDGDVGPARRVRHEGARRAGDGARGGGRGSGACRRGAAQPGTEHLRDRASRHGAPRVRGLRGRRRS